LQMARARRVAETEVELSEERLRLALDAGEIGSWECDPESGRMVTGGQFYCVLEEPADQEHERLETFLKRVHPEDRVAMDAALSEVVTREAQVHRLFRYPRNDGRTAWVEVHAKSHVGRTGKVTRVVGVVRDISAQQENEEQLRTAAEVFDVTGEGIFITDNTNHIIVANPSFRSITGYSDPEILGADVNELLFEEPLSSDFYSRIDAIPGGQWQGELRCRHKNGAQFPVWATISVVRDMSGVVMRYVVALSDITALRQAEERLVQLAYHDPLTGLPNRQLFNDRLERALARARRDSLTAALMFIDLDGFKEVNDRLGHATGDRVLREIADRIENTVRAADTAARFGGDEFLVLLDNVHQYEDAVQVAQKVLAAVAIPLKIGNEKLKLSASIGIALYPDDAQDPQPLLQAADAALYRAKAQGRNRFCFHTA
ncbi:MAG: diguanylate cyclase domain-containing protein, partial [Gammaproteobacteria bacterium]